MTEHSSNLLRQFGRATVGLMLAAMLFVTVQNSTRSTTLVACAGQQQTYEQIAADRGLTADVAAALLQHGMTASSLCTISDDILKRAVRKATTPKPDSPGESLRWRLLSLRDENGIIDDDGLANAKAHLDMMRGAASDEGPVAGIGRGTWSSVGPGNIGGRIRSLLIHPTTPAIMWIGSVGGGIWKTTDSGATWLPLDDFMANIAVSTMAMHPMDPDEIYAGTGEGYYNADGLRGAGIFKSVNGGTAWTQLASTSTAPGAGMTAADFQYVNRLAMSPNGTTLLAATRSGIYRSTDGGTTFTRATLVGGGALPLTNGITDIDFHPTNSNLAVAGTFSGTGFFSTDGGATWTASTGLPAAGTFDRVETVFAPSDGTIVYASADLFGSGPVARIYRSTNSGQTFTQVFESANVLRTQGWYDNVLWVNPADPNNLVWGGVDLWRSTNGGVSFTQISDWASWSATGPTSAHADHHVIVAHPGFNNTTNKTVFFGTDGGVYRADDISTIPACTPFTNTCKTGWTELNNTLGITQFYGGAGHPGTGRITGGTQDNGTLLYNPAVASASENWTWPFGGDGGFSAYDPLDVNYFYGEYVLAQVHRNTTGGTSPSAYIFNGIGDAGTQNAEFIAAFRLDPNNAARMLVAAVRLWRTNNVKGATPLTWEEIKATLGTGDKITAIGIAPGNSDLVYAGHNSGKLYKTTQATAVAATVLASWTIVDDNAGSNPLPNRRITRITVDANNNDIVYVTFGGFSGDNVYKSINGGASWTDITGPAGGATALPSVPVRSLVINPANSNWIYAGSEVGIFASSDAGATWGLPHDGPSNVSVDELFFVGARLVAATHGRGMFSTAVGSGPTISAIANQTTPMGVAVTANFTVADPDTPLASLILTGSSSNTALLPVSGITFGGSAGSRSVTLTPAAGAFGTATVTVTVSDGSATASSVFMLTVTAPPALAAIADQTAGTGTPLTVALTVSDPDTPASNLTLSGSSSNTAVLSNASIVFGGSGSSRTVTLTPGTTAGTTTVTIVVSDGSQTASRSFTLTVTAGPANLVAVVRGNHVTFTWVGAGAADGYALEAGLTAGSTFVSLLVGNVTAFEITAPHGVFFVRVRALVGGSPGLASNEVMVAVGDAAIPGAPANLLGGVNGATVNLAWHNTPIGGTRSGLVLQAAMAASPDVVIAQLPLPANAESFAIGAPAGSYSVRIVATGPAGSSAPSNAVVVTVPGACAPPATPQLLTATNVGLAVTISWLLGPVGTPAPTSFVLEAGFSPGAADAAVLATTERGISAFAPPGTYHLRVRAVTPCGASPNTADVVLVVP